MTVATHEKTVAKKPNQKKLWRRANRIAFEIAIAGDTLAALANMSEDYENVSHSAEFLGKVIRRRADRLMEVLDAMDPVDLGTEQAAWQTPQPRPKRQIFLRGGVQSVRTLPQLLQNPTVGLNHSVLR